MKTYEIEFTVRVTAQRSGPDDDEALDELLAELELVPGVDEVELMDICDCYEAAESGDTNA